MLSYRRFQSPQKNFKVGKVLPNWGEHLPKDVCIHIRSTLMSCSVFGEQFYVYVVLPDTVPRKIALL